MPTLQLHLMCKKYNFDTQISLPTLPPFPTLPPPPPLKYPGYASAKGCRALVVRTNSVCINTRVSVGIHVTPYLGYEIHNMYQNNPGSGSVHKTGKHLWHFVFNPL